jgi:hypothetical protein
MQTILHAFLDEWGPIRSALRKSFTTRQLFEVVLVLGLFAMAARGIGDPDFWWHLRTGQQIVATHSIPHFDSYSYTKFGAPWVAHEWLSEVFIYSIYCSAGYLGLIITFAIAIAGAFWLAFRRSGGRPYIAGVVTLWGAIATIPFWGIRPQILSLLLTSVFLFLLDRFDKTGRGALLWLMPPLMVLWVNVHGGFAIGLALLLVAIGCKLLEALLHTESRARSLGAARALAAVMATCLLAVVINPNGLRIYRYPFETLASPSIQGYISEWASPNFHSAGMQTFALLLLATFSALALGGKRPGTRDFVLLVVIAFAALNSSRHIPLFAMVAIPILAAGIESVLAERNWLPGFRVSNSRKSKTALNLTIALGLILFCVVRVRIVLKRQPALEAQELPLAAAEYIRQQHPPGTIFNSYEWGGYLIWTLYPDYRVFVDGRCDMYGDQFLDEFVHTYKAENDWRTVLLRFGANTVILPPEAPLAVALRESPEWDVTFYDSHSIVLVRRTAAARQF